ncbi:MAG: rhomboid family intramembrane serine protease [Verrucomicrobia bacterium]|jgi:membrane associated rhomboid family serine protease|nr:rhomboid family intramembrane serine protease [Verrucomicrobiota bacterium]
MFGIDTSDRTAPACIPTASRSQAMDWSLVLLSQGIESTLMHDPESRRWQILVAADKMKTVLETLRLYEKENRAWPFRQQLPWPGLAFDWTVLAWVAIIATTYWLQSRPDSPLTAAGMCTAGLARSGEWWRPLTATMLHADPGHLAMNVVFGVLLMGTAMGRFGSGLTLLVATLAGIGANLVPLLWREDKSGALGASGVVMAALGLIAAAAAVHYWQRKHPPRLVLEAIVGGMLLFVLVGVSPTSDVAAHAGGFLFGLLLGLPLAALPLTRIRQARLNLVAGLIYCLLVIVAWGCALVFQAR